MNYEYQIIIKKNSQIKRRNLREGEKGSVEREYYFYFFLLFVCFSDLWKSDRNFLSGLKAKLIYATRATCGHQNLGLEAVKGRKFQFSNFWTEYRNS